jgi:hypothetical protein
VTNADLLKLMLEDAGFTAHTRHASKSRRASPTFFLTLR